MALKFQPPQGADTTSPNEAFNKGLGNSISNLPLLYQQAKLAHSQALMENEKLALLRKPYGTGAPAPVAQGPVDASGVGPVTPPESFDSKLGRVGPTGIEAEAKLLAAQDKANKPEGIIYYSPSTKKTALTKGELSDGVAIEAKTAAIHQAMNTPGAIIKNNPDGTIEIQYTSPGQKNTVVTPPSDKETPKKEAKAKAKELVQEQLDQLRVYYQKLDKAGGIVDTKKGGLSNIVRKAKSSGVGQLAGSIVGTENQSTRQSIINARPQLVNTIRQATGGSARAIDSNVELQTYLNTATDPKQDVQSNIEAINNLEKLYGVGSADQPDDEGGGEIKRQTKDGKIAVFDANKNFIRYE